MSENKVGRPKAVLKLGKDSFVKTVEFSQAWHDWQEVERAKWMTLHDDQTRVRPLTPALFARLPQEIAANLPPFLRPPPLPSSPSPSSPPAPSIPSSPAASSIPSPPPPSALSPSSAPSQSPPRKNPKSEEIDTLDTGWSGEDWGGDV